MSEHKPNGSKTDIPTRSELHSTAKSAKSVAAELNAKITAKQNSRLKHQQQQQQNSHSNGTKIDKHMDPPKQKSSHHGLSSHKIVQHHDLHNQTPYIDVKNPSSILKNSFHNFHDVESHLSGSKISINDFKTKSSAPAALNLNLKRNYL
jgi:hypothetical protein